MAKRSRGAERAEGGVVSGAQKWFTGIVTMLAALMALLVNAKNLGLSEWAGFLVFSVADQAAHRIVLTPRVDTLTAIGEPAVITAIVTDARGAALSGATLRWRTSDSSVAAVDSSGLIVARAPGRATIEARVRDVTATAAVLVRPVPEHVRIAGDSAVRVADGDTLALEAAALDARGHLLRGAPIRWSAADAAVATVDPLGVLRTAGTGRTMVWAAIGELRDTLLVEVALTPAVIVVESGAAQRALAGRALAAPVVLQVRARSGAPVPGVPVELVTEDAVGAMQPGRAVTDAAGRVRVSWTLGATAGMQRAFARAAGIDSALVLEAEADPERRNTRVEVLQRDSAGTVLQAFAQPLRVRVTDSAGTALTGVRVAWTAPDGGEVSGAARTDSLGWAEARWTLGRRAGAQRVLVQVGNPRYVPAMTVRVIARPGPAATLELTGGDRQRGTAGKALARAVSVVVRDSVGNPVAGEAIDVTVTAGVLADSSLTTDAAGVARARWTLGPRPGEQRVTFVLRASKLRVQAIASAMKHTGA